MKKLIIINGTMGVGKTTICKKLYTSLNKSVWLDGDWCWMMNPLVVNEENKQMVEDNILHLLRNFMKNSNFEYIIFNWVIHKAEILNSILEELEDYEFEVCKISLVCSESTLRERMLNDGRDMSSIESSVRRLKLYDEMDTIKIDTTNKTVESIVEGIIKLV